MTSNLNPYVVDLSIHTEALFGLIKSKKVHPEATLKTQTTPSELFANYAADTKNYSRVYGQATPNSLGVYTCYYLFRNTLLKCISPVKPGWRSKHDNMESGMMSCTSPDSDNSVLVPYPSDKVLWSIT